MRILQSAPSHTHVYLLVNVKVTIVQTLEQWMPQEFVPTIPPWLPVGAGCVPGDKKMPQFESTHIRH